MIKSVTVINYRNESIKLELTNPWETGLAISSITGIGPSKATINTTDLASSDGSIYNSARTNQRNIVISFKLLPDPVTTLVEDTRQRTYRYFPVKRQVTLMFETDNRLCLIDGYVESNEPDIFQKEETAQISILCPDPYFKVKDQTIVLNGIENLFEFPFSNESTTENLIEMSNTSNLVSNDYIYDGDVDNGCVFRIHASGPVNKITLYNVTTQEKMVINTSMINGDDIYVSSEHGNRYIYRIRNNVREQLLSALDKLTQWIHVTKGVNRFSYSAVSGSNNITIDVDINILYEGV